MPADGYRRLGLRFLRLWITPRRIHPVAAIGAGEAAGLAGADDHQGAHAHLLGGEFAEGQAAQGFAGAAGSYVGPALSTRCNTC